MKKTPRNAVAKAPPVRKSGGGMLLGLFLGLVVGVSIAFGVVVYLNKAPLPFVNKYEGAPKDSVKPGGAGTAANPSAPGGAAEPISLPGKPGDKVSEKQRFDFYGILEGKSAAQGENRPPSPSPAAGTVVEAKPKAAEVYFLQAGAFQKPSDADKVKAKLALLGIEATVQEAEIVDRGKMHRVRIGPLGSLDETNRVRTQLSQGGIDTTLIKTRSD